MNITIISPPILRTPPSGGYGGIERAAWWLTKGLCERGHWIDLVAREDSNQPPRGRLFKAKDDDDIPNVIATMESINGKSDVYIDFSHNHLLSVVRQDLPQINCHSVMSLMGSGLNPVCISHGQARDKFGEHETEVIHYGLDMEEYPLYVGPRDSYLVYMGQLIPEKRIEWACEVALKTNRPLRIYGPGWGPAEYHDLLRKYEAESNGLIQILGEIGATDKIEVLQKAHALIHPVGGMGWCEAGAIVVLESLAVGTPVIVSDNGCLPEYVNVSVGGFSVGFSLKTAEDMVECITVGAIETLTNPEACRKRAEDFSMSRMAESYEKLAIEIMNGRRWNIPK